MLLDAQVASCSSRSQAESETYLFQAANLKSNFRRVHDLAIQNYDTQAEQLWTFNP